MGSVLIKSFPSGAQAHQNWFKMRVEKYAATAWWYRSSCAAADSTRPPTEKSGAPACQYVAEVPARLATGTPAIANVCLSYIET